MSSLEIHPKRFDILSIYDESCRFNNNVDVLNECFGANRSMYMHASYPQGKNQTISGTKEGERFFVWMPKLYGNSSEWKNSISEDGKTIYEVAEDSRETDWMDYGKHDLGALRIVFLKPTPKSPYEFVGVFNNGKMEHLHHEYHRIATRVKLVGDPVTRIEILDAEQRPDNAGVSAIEERLESLCKRFDPSVTIVDSIKQRADEFTQYVHTRDQNDELLNFTNPNSVLAEEIYKKQCFERAQSVLGIDLWDESWIGTDKIFERIKTVINESSNNLVYRLNKTDFNDHFRKVPIGRKNVYDSRSELAVYKVFKGNDDKEAFVFSTEVFGKKFPTIAYLFFIKDDTRYLPMSPENFERCFRQLNIDIKLQNNCSWENYNVFLQIITCIQELMPVYLPLDHKPTLLEAHSFVWMIGGKGFSNWLQGRKNKQALDMKAEQKRIELIEQKQERVPQKRLSEFNDEQLMKIGPYLIGKEIQNATKGKTEVLDFVGGAVISMQIQYKEIEGAKPINIELTDVVRSNYSISMEMLDEIEYGNNSDSESNKALPDEVSIPDDEDEQIAQAVAMPIDQLELVAEQRETVNPEKHEVSTTQYKRDHYIAELAKREANGVCQLCGANAPFVDGAGIPYLESHHIIWLSQGGSDTIDNTIAVCPNCHRRLHVLNDEGDVEHLKMIKKDLYGDR